MPIQGLSSAPGSQQQPQCASQPPSQPLTPRSPGLSSTMPPPGSQVQNLHEALSRSKVARTPPRPAPMRTPTVLSQCSHQPMGSSDIDPRPPSVVSEYEDRSLSNVAAAIEVLQAGFAEQQRQQEVQAAALREGLMEIHSQRAALTRLLEQAEKVE